MQICMAANPLFFGGVFCLSTVVNCNEFGFVFISKGYSVWTSSSVYVVDQTTRCLDALIIQMGVFVKKSQCY